MNGLRSIMLKRLFIFLFCFGFACVSTPWGQPSDVLISDATGAGGLGSEATGMTLYELLEAGGWIMYVLAFLSVIGLALVFYYTFALRERRMVPKDQVNQIRLYLRDGRYEDIARICRRSKNMLSKIVLAGILRGAVEPASAASTMETVGRREAETLMRRVRYLSDIGTLSPLLGLLGTVLGMINAFNFIAFDISAVKPVALASAVAQALITTAAGLIIAIPCMGFYFYFRAKLQDLVARVEEIAVEVHDILNAAKPKKTTATTRRKASVAVEEES